MEPAPGRPSVARGETRPPGAPGRERGEAPAPRDCPECGSVGAVVASSFCEVCYAETDEFGGGEAAALPPAASRPAELRLSDVLDELDRIAGITGDPSQGPGVAVACRRAAVLLQRLRAQFVTDLGIAPAAPPVGGRAREGPGHGRPG